MEGLYSSPCAATFAGPLLGSLGPLMGSLGPLLSAPGPLLGSPRPLLGLCWASAGPPKTKTHHRHHTPKTPPTTTATTPTTLVINEHMENIFGNYENTCVKNELKNREV